MTAKQPRTPLLRTLSGAAALAAVPVLLSGCSAGSSPTASPKDVIAASVAAADASGLLVRLSADCPGGIGPGVVELYAYDPEANPPVAMRFPGERSDPILGDRDFLLPMVLSDAIEGGAEVGELSSGGFTVSDASSDYPLPDPGYTVTVADGRVATVTFQPIGQECPVKASMEYSPSPDQLVIVRQLNEDQREQGNMVDLMNELSRAEDRVRELTAELGEKRDEVDALNDVIREQRSTIKELRARLGE